MGLTEYQTRLMKHTISGPDRNWFATSFNSKDSEEFEKLVKAGYATSRPAPAFWGDDIVYSLTDAGRKALKHIKPVE